MRKLVLALVATLAVALVPSAASAQSLRQILGVVSAGSAYGYNSCSYVGGGVGQAFCQVNRASNVANTISDVVRQQDDRRRQEFDRRASQLNALQRACQAGDQQSCARSGGPSGKQMEVARALMDACTAGDRASCNRATAMMDERNITASYQQQQGGYPQQGYAPRGYAPQRTAQAQVCQPVYDRDTGYRIAGVCR